MASRISSSAAAVTAGTQLTRHLWSFKAQPEVFHLLAFIRRFGALTGPLVRLLRWWKQTLKVIVARSPPTPAQTSSSRAARSQPARVLVFCVSLGIE